MVYIYKSFSPNEASSPPNSYQHLPRGTAVVQMSPANQKRPGRYQFHHPPPDHPPRMSFVGYPQFQPISYVPPQYPPVTCAPPQVGPVTFDPSQCPLEYNAFGQQTFNGYPPQQQPPCAMSSQHYPSMNFGLQQGPPNFATQQVMSPVDYVPPETMFGAPAQFAPPPMYSPEANLMPFNEAVPPPGFEPNVNYGGQNSNFQYDSRCTPSPSFANCNFNPLIPPETSHFPTIPMQPFPLFIPSQKMPNQRRPKAIAIIDPATGMDKLNEIYGKPKSETDSKESTEADNRSTNSQ
ncbi:early nodulin-75-like [Anoplophora glabripennis]|uniref:early nodulin-75-like n=1 Tax=Anoplophora glabripennis TaxID=217634 RepID=UPI00087524A2|nr:early nodulin-75-like [Anoplophora glabripennis]